MFLSPASSSSDGRRFRPLGRTQGRPGQNGSGQTGRTFIMEAQQPWSRSRSAGDLSSIFLMNNDNVTGSGSRKKTTEFYRISRRRIVGSAMRAAEEELEEEEVEQPSDEQGRRRRRIVKRSSTCRSSLATMTPPADTTTTAMFSASSDRVHRRPKLRASLSLSSNDDERFGGGNCGGGGGGGGGGCGGRAMAAGRRPGQVDRRRERAAIGRHRSVELNEVKEGSAKKDKRSRSEMLCSRRGSIQREAGRRSVEEEISPLEDASTTKLRFCRHRRSVLVSGWDGDGSTRRGTLRSSRSQGNLVEIKEEMEQPVEEPPGYGRRTLEDEDCARKVTEARLLNIASFHHLPRLPIKKPVSAKPMTACSGGSSSTDASVQASAAASASGDKSDQLEEDTPDGGRRHKAQEKRRRNRTLTFGVRQVFLPPPDPVRKKVNAKGDADANENLSGTSGSDPGICLNFGSSEEEASEADSLEVDARMFAPKDSDPADCGWVQHSYIASRGQREREEEIYEVLPATIRVKKKKKTGRQRMDRGESSENKFVKRML